MKLRALFLSLGFVVAALPVVAGELDGIIAADVRPGWRQDDGTHLAAVHLRLAEGWKTYWRAPGDAGIPPRFDWSGSRNVTGIAVEWPTPKVFWQDGTPSVGYHDELVLPLRVSAADPGADIGISGRIDLGLCDEICLPYTVDVSATLPAVGTRKDPVITAALVSRPFSAAEAGVTSATCAVEPIDGGLRVTARIAMPDAGGREDTLIEAGNPEIWVSFPSVERVGAVLVATANLYHVTGESFALNRGNIRITVLGSRYGVDIRGCDAPG